MDSLTHFQSRNVYFYIYYSNILKVTALDMFQKTFGFTPPLTTHPVFFDRLHRSCHAVPLQYYCKLEYLCGYSPTTVTGATVHVNAAKHPHSALKGTPTMQQPQQYCLIKDLHSCSQKESECVTSIPVTLNKWCNQAKWVWSRTNNIFSFSYTVVSPV